MITLAQTAMNMPFVHIPKGNSSDFMGGHTRPSVITKESLNLGER